MQFFDSTNGTGLCQDTDFLVGTNSDSYTRANKARNMNNWLRTLVAWIWEVNDDWQYDDSNLATLPIATTNMVAAQKDYELPTIAKIERCEVMDNNGDWVIVKPIDWKQVTETAMEEFRETDGLPEYYDMVGNSLMLYPAPSATDCTLANGLKIYVERDIDAFSSTDTTQEPGVPDNFHRILSLGAAMDYCLAKGLMDKAKDFLTMIEYMKKEVQRFYSKRNIDMKVKIHANREECI